MRSERVMSVALRGARRDHDGMRHDVLAVVELDFDEYARNQRSHARRKGNMYTELSRPHARTTRQRLAGNARRKSQDRT